MTVDGVAVENGFDKRCYYARGNSPLSITFTNSTPNGVDPAKAPALVFAIFAADKPGFGSLPGRPGDGSGSTANALFVSSPVQPGARVSFDVPPITAGRYVVQAVVPFPMSSATLVVQ